MTLVRSTTRYVAALAFLWWVLGGTEPASWAVGLPVMVLATALSMAIAPSRPWKWRLRVIPAFAWFFLKESLRGGIDVARRAYSVHMSLQPAMLNYPLHLPDGPARVFLLNVLSLRPGTLSADIRENTITIHTIDTSLPVEQELRELEKSVGSLFAVDLKPEQETGNE